MKLIENMIAYALIRDKYRSIRKKEFKEGYTFFVGLVLDSEGMGALACSQFDMRHKTNHVKRRDRSHAFSLF